MTADDARALAEAVVRECIATQQELLDGDCLKAVADAAGIMSTSLRRGGKLVLFGNGGSASDASHIAAEFVGRFLRDRRPLPAISLNTNHSAMTAIANDYGFEHIFARQVEALGAAEDVAIALSTSGRSPNVLAGVRAARSKGMDTIGLTGAEGGELAGAVDVCVRIPSTSTARIQESHILVAHVLCELVERDLG